MTEPMSLPVKFKVVFDKKEIEEYFKTQEKLTPVTFGFTCEHAEALEYGTGPLSDYQPTVNGGNYTYKQIFDEIYKWCSKKEGDGLPIQTPQGRYKFSKNVTDHFFTVGMKPHPYWRVALMWLENNMQPLFDQGYSLFEIADEALRVANKCIMDQQLFFTGDLQKSAFIDRLSPDSAGDPKEVRYEPVDRARLEREAGWAKRK